MSNATEDPEQTLASRSASRYLLAVAAGLLGSVALFYGALALMQKTGNLPPPAFSNSLCVDEKLSFLRDNPPDSPDLLVMGSSVAWRHFDGDAVVARSRDTQPLNGAFCGLHANQSVYVANWLLDREPTVRQVVMIVDPLDFADCTSNRNAVFDRGDADRYVYGQQSRWGFYVRYFAPASLLRNARQVADQRANRNELDPLVFNRFGDGPLDTRAQRDSLKYDLPRHLDGACFAALGEMATRLRQEQRPFTVVTTPLHPLWKVQQDPDGSYRKGFNARLNAALDGGSARVWDADRDWPVDTAAFTDAIHLRWSAARRFSEALVSQLDLEPSASGQAVAARRTP